MQAPTHEPKHRRTISLEDRLWQFAKQVGHGNVSLGVRFILEEAFKENDSSSVQRAPNHTTHSNTNS